MPAAPAPQGGADRPILTIEDLAARWQVGTKAAWEVVRSQGVPFLAMGPGRVDLARKGGRLIRFRLAAVESWEARRDSVWLDPAAAEESGRRAQAGRAARKPTRGEAKQETMAEIEAEGRRLMGY